MCEGVAGSFYDASCVSLGRPWYYRRSKETWRGRALPPCLGCGYEACAVFAGISWEASRGPLGLSGPWKRQGRFFTVFVLPFFCRFRRRFFVVSVAVFLSFPIAVFYRFRLPGWAPLPDHRFFTGSEPVPNRFRASPGSALAKCRFPLPFLSSFRCRFFFKTF